MRRRMSKMKICPKCKKQSKTTSPRQVRTLYELLYVSSGHVMRAVICAAILCCLLAVATSASAEEPTGFLEWSWGTPKATRESKFLLPRCKSRTSEPVEPTVCGPYQLGDIAILSMRLNFKPNDALSG